MSRMISVRSRRALVLSLFALVFSFSFAQPRMEIAVRGTVVDSKTSEPLQAAVVKATSSNGGDGTFAITDDKGVFTLTINRPGKYSLEFSFLGYKTFTKDYSFYPHQANNVGKIKMEEDAVMLKEAQVIGKNMRVKQTADTTVINADGYKVMDGATADQLIAKMPGFKVTDSGVEAQGEQVKKVMVDGKEFFENDPKLALRTLPAEVVQSVAVFDKKSDQAEFTGFDDGQSVKALDVRTRSYKRNGVFGKATAQGGHDAPADAADGKYRYNANFNVNVFNDDRRVTVMGLSNNVNQRNFSFDDLMSAGAMGGMGGRMWGAQNGVATANALGTNYSDVFMDGKVELQGNYFFNMTDTHQEDSTFNDYLTMDRRTEAYSSSDTRNANHNLGMRISIRPSDRDEIIFRPRVGYQRNDATASSRNYTISPYADVLARDTASTTKESHTYGDGYNVGGNLVWRHRLGKEGRTFSVGASGTLSGSQSQSDDSKTYNRNYAEQQVNNDTHSGNYNLDATWTEPLSATMQLSASLRMGHNHSESSRRTYYGIMKDPVGNVTAQDSTDINLTNDFVSDYRTQGIDVGYRFHNETFNAMARMELERADLSGRQIYTEYQRRSALGTDPSYAIPSHVYYNVNPMAMVEWTGQGGNSLRFFYHGNTNAPGINQLQQSVNNANPLSLSTGNPSLDPSHGHSIYGRFIHSNMERATNLQLFAGGDVTLHPIGNVTTINAAGVSLPVTAIADGFYDAPSTLDQFAGITLYGNSQISRPANLTTPTYGFWSTVTYGFPVDFLMSNLNFSLSARRTVYHGLQETLRPSTTGIYKPELLTTTSINRQLAPGFDLTSNISQNLDFSLAYEFTYSDVESSTSPRTYLNHGVTGTFSWVIWKGITMEHELDYLYYGGTAMDGNPVTTLLWNASLGRKFFNNQLELKLSGYDILGSAKSYSRTVSDYAITTSYYNVMPRYFMLTAVWNIRAFKGVNTAAEPMRGGMGPGMGHRF